jgi:hypothetical protein
MRTREEMEEFARERREDAKVCRELADFFRAAANVNDAAAHDANSIARLLDQYGEVLRSDSDRIVSRYFEGMHRLKAGTRFFARLEQWGKDLKEWFNTHSNGPPPGMPASPMPKNTGLLE